MCDLGSGVTKFGYAGQEDVRVVLELGLDLLSGKSQTPVALRLRRSEKIGTSG